MKLEEFRQIYYSRFIGFLEGFLSTRTRIAKDLQDAMAYTLLGGGKRLRPLLVYASGHAFNAHPEDLDLIAAAVECIHIYTLIHDDLPALDNDDLRHGRPSCHKQFNEASAIICGDALQSIAFEILSRPMRHVVPARQLQMIHLLAHAIGDQGVAGGQMLDISAEETQASLPELETIHRLKTGELIQAAINMGALAGNIDELEELPRLKLFAENLGLMFQIHDDILDLTSSTEKLGKPQGSDLNNQKSTYPSLLGLDKAVELAWQTYHQALNTLDELKGHSTSLLREIATFMIERDH